MTQPPLSESRLADDDFDAMRRANLARWPTGAGVDLHEAVAYLNDLPPHKHLAHVTRMAVAGGRCLTQPRGGFGTFEMHSSKPKFGAADRVPRCLCTAHSQRCGRARKLNGAILTSG